ncbi:hypothetical protein [Streptomyces sp. NRRL S-118]|nr:hypothetical protein [Streptomyces sp. NRRL S-118]
MEDVRGGVGDVFVPGQVHRVQVLGDAQARAVLDPDVGTVDGA